MAGGTGLHQHRPGRVYRLKAPHGDCPENAPTRVYEHKGAPRKRIGFAARHCVRGWRGTSGGAIKRAGSGERPKTPPAARLSVRRRVGGDGRLRARRPHAFTAAAPPGLYSSISPVMLFRLSSRVEELCSRAETAGGSTPRAPSSMSAPLKPITKR